MIRAKIVITILFSLWIILFISSCEKELSTTPPEEPPPTGVLYINTAPLGYQIWLDGKNTGRITPDSIPWIEEKEYQVTLKRFRWRDTSFTMHAYETHPVDTLIDYYKNPAMYGRIDFKSDPTNTKIFFNDSLLGISTPYQLKKVLPGRYKVRYTMENHRDGLLAVDVYSSKTSTAFYKLRDTSLWVDYTIYNSGLPYNALSSIIIDQNNVKWIGTLDKGLIKMVGTTFTQLSVSNSGLPSNKIKSLEIDLENKLWIGTDEGGLVIYDGIDWTIYNRSNSSLPSNTVTAIEFTQNAGSVLIGTSNNVVEKIGDSFTSYKFIDLANVIVSVTDLYQENETTFWVGTSNYGIYRFSGRKFEEFINWEKNPFNTNIQKHAPTRNIVKIKSDLNGNVWVGSNFDFVEYTVQPGNRIVRKTKNGGVSVYNGNSWTGDMFIVAPNEINDLYCDDKNQIWVGTEEGLYVYSTINYKKKFIKDFNELSGGNVTGIAKDKNGIVWITTFDGGLNKYKGEL